LRGIEDAGSYASFEEQFQTREWKESSIEQHQSSQDHQ